MTVTRGVALELASVDQGDLDRSAFLASLPRWELHEDTQESQLADRIRAAQVVVVNKLEFDSARLALAPELKLIALTATGANNIDLQAARERGVSVCNVRNYASQSVAQHVLTMILCLTTGMPWYRDRVQAGDWCRATQFSLFDRPIRQIVGRVAGIVGYGDLGRATANLLEAVGMQVLVAEREGDACREGRVPLSAVISRADVISLHCPLNERTRNLFNAGRIGGMKPSALLINTARGGIVDEPALAEALRRGVIAGAGVDTLTQEPPPADHPLLANDVPNLLVTPHNAWASLPARQTALDQVARVVSAFRNGRPINLC